MQEEKTVNRWKKRTALLMTGICLISAAGPARAAEADLLEDQIQQTASEGIRAAADISKGSLLDQEDLLPAGDSLSDWVALTLALSGEKEAYSAYLTRLETYVTEQYSTYGCLDDMRATEYHRIGLTVLALGGDPTSFGKDADQNPVDLVADGVWNFAGGDPGVQGINGDIYALLLLDARDYEVPEEAVYTREYLVNEILSAETADGGFGLSAGEADVDITSMAVQALAPYENQQKVRDAIEEALNWLSGQMSENGTFTAYGEESAESSAQAILALCAVGTDPAKDSRFFTPSGNTGLLDGLEHFRQEDGSYAHSDSDTGGNLMATEQALLALEALEKLRTTGNGRIFDFTDYEGPQNAGTQVPVIGIAVIVVVLAAGGIVVINRKNSRKGKKEHV